MGMTGLEAAAARRAGLATAAGLEGYWQEGDLAGQEETRWLEAAGMSLRPDVAAEVLRLTTGRLDESAAAAAMDGALVRAARAYLRATRARRGMVSGALQDRIAANGAAADMLTTRFRLVQNGESEAKYGGEAARLLRFATRVSAEQATRFGLGDEHHPLLAAGAALLESVRAEALDEEAVARRVHAVLGVFASRIHDVWEPDARHAIWLPALSVCHAVCGVTTKVREAKEVTPLVAALKYTLKCWALQEMAEIGAGAGAGGGRDGDAAGDTMERITAVLLAVDEDDPANSALSVLGRLSRTATAACNPGGVAVVTWCTRAGHGQRQCAIVGNCELSIGSVRGALQASLAAARTLIRRLLFEDGVAADGAVGVGDESVFDRRIARMMAAMEDDARCEQVGSCWATAGNGRRVLAGADRLVLSRLAARGPEVFQSYARPPAPGDADAAFDAYMEMVKELHGHIAFWTHMATGGCPRGVELGLLQIRTTRNLQRGLFLRTSGADEPQVFVAPQYDKRAARQGNRVTCYRFFAAGLMSSMLFAYVTLVKPFEAVMVLARQSASAARVCLDYLFVDKAGRRRSAFVVRGFVTGTLVRALGSGAGRAMSFGELRHWSKAVHSAHLLSGDDASSKLVAAGFGHGEQVGGLVYGTTAEVGRTGTAASHEAFRAHAARVHALFSIGGRPPDAGLSPVTSAAAAAVVVAPAPPRTRPTLAPAPVPAPASAECGAAREMLRAVVDLLEARLPAEKRAWSAAGCGMPGVAKLPRLTGRGAAGSDTHTGIASSVVACLQLALKDPRAAPRSAEQMEAIALALENRQDFLVVLPTGAGKSLVYIVPALMDRSKVTAVVVPTAALVGGAVAGCVRTGLRARAAAECEVAADAMQLEVIVFSMEALESAGGQRILAGLAGRGALRQIVLDEAHTLWEWRGFRCGARYIATLVRGGSLTVPLVGLTATASPATVELLRGTVCAWDVVVRASTVRPGVRYAVLPVRSKTEATSATVRLVRGAAAGAKHLVFCMTIYDCEHVVRALAAEKVPAVAYHGALPAEEKEAADAAFREAGSGAGAGTAAPPFVAVCTAGYGLGLHIPDVVATVHYGGARSVAAFMQESGRAGRGAAGGGAATCTVVLCEAIRTAAMGARVGMTSYGEPGAAAGGGRPVDRDADYRDLDFPASTALSASTTFRAICEQTTECVRMLLHNDVDGGRFGPQICVALPGAALCHVCSKGLDVARAAVGGGPGRSGAAAKEAAPPATPVRASVEVMRARGREDARIRQLFMATKSRLGDANCAVCWVVDNGALAAHGLRDCRHVGGRCFDCLGEGCGAGGVGRRVCREAMHVKLGQRLCVACGLGMFGGGDVHEDSSLEFGNKRACTVRKMLRAAVAMWRFKREAVEARFPALAGTTELEFLAKVAGSGSESLPLTIRMGVWWAESVAGASPAREAAAAAAAAAAARRTPKVQTYFSRTPAGVALRRPGTGSTGSGRASSGPGRGGLTAPPTSRTLFPGT